MNVWPARPCSGRSQSTPSSSEIRSQFLDDIATKGDRGTSPRAQHQVPDETCAVNNRHFQLKQLPSGFDGRLPDDEAGPRLARELPGIGNHQVPKRT